MSETVIHKEHVRYKLFSDYTQEEKVKFMNTFRSNLEKELNRQVSDFDLIVAACRTSESFLNAFIKS